MRSLDGLLALRELSTEPVDGHSVRVAFAAGGLCRIRLVRESGRRPRLAEVGATDATWRRQDDVVDVHLGSAIARYRYRAGGTLGDGTYFPTFATFAPEFAEQVGPLPPAPLFDPDDLEGARIVTRGPRDWRERASVAVMRVLERLPWWTRGALVGAAIMIVWTLGRIVTRTASGRVRFEDGTSFWLGAGLALGIAAFGGLVAGGAATLFWRPLRPLRYVGDLLNGVLSMFVYLALTASLFGKFDVSSPRALGAWLAVSVVGGLVVGHVFIREASQMADDT